MADEERLIVALEARIRDFERNMNKARRTATSEFSEMEKRARQSGDRLESIMAKASQRVGGVMKDFGKGFVGGIFGGLAVGGLDQIIEKVGKVAEGVANIGSAAKRAGIDTRSFQELSFVAEQNRISVDALTDGIKELNLRADEWIVTGGGAAAESFKRLGYTADELKRKLKDPSALLVEIIGRLQQLDRAAQIRIADELFGGTAGERFVELLDQGAAGIRKQIDEAHRLGVVLDDDVIRRADEIDRKFKAIASTIDTEVKLAIVSTAGAMADWWDSLNAIEEQSSRSLGDRLAEIGQRKLEIENEILKLKEAQAAGETGIGDGYLGHGVGETSILERLQELQKESDELSALEQRVLGALDKQHTDTGAAAKEAAPDVRTLNSALTGTGTAGTSAVDGLKSYTDAIRALKAEIPELADQLRILDARSRIDAIYRAALQKARTMGEVYQANALRDRALSAMASKDVSEAASRGMLDLIGFAEGTDKGRGYNETLAYGAFTGGDRTLVTMTLDQIDALQSQMLRHPDNTYNSSALGRFQITQTTLRGLREQLGLSGGEFFDKEMQDRLAEELLRQRGNDVGGLRNEWEGLRRVDDATIRNAYNGASVSMPAIDPGKAANIEQAREQAKAYAEIVASSKQFTAQQQQERGALDMTTTAAAALRYEQQMLNDAQRQNIQLTPQQRAQIHQLAQGMAQAEGETARYSKGQEDAAQTARFFGEQAVGALSGILTGTQSVEEALKGVIDALIRAAFQALILGDGPLAGLFGGGSKEDGGGGGGGIGAVGGLIGALFGFADGGLVRGPGTSTSDSIPARLSDGEYVVNARATAKHRALLEAVNNDNLPGFATGGYVGNTAMPIAPGGVAQAITISAPITVNGSAGTPEQNADLARQMARQMEATMRGVVSDELRRASRPGNVGNQRGGR